tara:strand:+ start:54 stop:506 length:453 start_codon:yes stop_codon:yes gene_type:complete
MRKISFITLLLILGCSPSKNVIEFEVIYENDSIKEYYSKDLNASFLLIQDSLIAVNLGTDLNLIRKNNSNLYSIGTYIRQDTIIVKNKIFESNNQSIGSSITKLSTKINFIPFGSEIFYDTLFYIDTIQVEFKKTNYDSYIQHVKPIMHR